MARKVPVSGTAGTIAPSVESRLQGGGAVRTKLLTIVMLAIVAVPFGARAGSRFDYSWSLPEWRATWSAPKLADNRGFAVRSDAEGVYVAGVTAAHGQGAGDLFVLRYSHAGALVWARTWGGFQLDQAQGLALDADTVWAAGAFTGDDGVRSFAVVRFSKSGELLLSKTWARGVSSVLQGIAIADGGVYVTGFTEATRANSDLYVARLSDDGAIAWEKTFGGAGFDEGWDITAEDGIVYVSGFETGAFAEQAVLVRLEPDGDVISHTLWGGAGDHEARAIAVGGDAIYVTGAVTNGESSDLLFAKLTRTGTVVFSRTSSGAIVGGGGYGISIGERGVYVAGGTYDFPAGGDGAVFRFSRAGDLEWASYYGLPGFWDWGFDVDVRDGSFYVAGVLYQPGPEYYSVVTMRYREDFPTVTLTGVAQQIVDGDAAGAQRALSHWWVADFMRWAKATDLSAPEHHLMWEGASDSGRQYGTINVDSAGMPPVSQNGAVEAFSALQKDFVSGNYSLVRDWTAVSGSLADGFIRFRYCVSHDRLIPQGGFVYIGDFRIPLPPPPV